MFPETIKDKIFEKSSSFHVKQLTAEKFNFCFQGVLLVLTKFSFWEEDWTLGYNSMQFWHYSELSWFPKNQILSCVATHEATRIYLFITNSLSLVLKRKFGKTSKHSQIMDNHGCLQNFILYFMSLLTILVFKSSHTLAGVYLIFPRLN